MNKKSVAICSVQVKCAPMHFAYRCAFRCQSAETGSIKIEPVSVSIGDLVDDAVELVKTIAEKESCGYRT